MSDNPPRSALSPAEGSAPQPAPIDLVLDTNVLLALWLFQDPALEPLRLALASGQVRWRATAAMLEELALVVSRPYPARYRPGPELRSPPACLSVEPAAPAPWRCRDLADQKFLDLAWSLQLPLCSRDRDLLSLRRRGAARGLHIEAPEVAQARLLPR
jgi:predicted nucleic acid-binding protein